MSGQLLVPRDAKTRLVKRLSIERSTLAHFSATTLVLEVPAILDMTANALEIVEFLLTKAFPFDTIVDPGMAVEARAAMAGLRIDLATARTHYSLLDLS